MKVIFLDIDGVVNCATTKERHRGCIGIDPYLAFIFWKITLEVPEVKIVLSSSWRCNNVNIEEIKRQVLCDIYDVTPPPWYEKENNHHSTRGEEIKKWLDAHPEVERYAIVDDDTRILPEQIPNFFKTTWEKGLDQETADRITAHIKQ